MKKQRKCKICGNNSKTKFCLKCCSANHGYAIRNYNLSRLGYASYDQYLNSDLWKSIKDRKLSERPMCDLCLCKASMVHHQCYSQNVLKGNNLQKLHSLCKKCHYIVEFENGKKLPFGRAVAKYRRIKKTVKYKRYTNNI